MCAFVACDVCMHNVMSVTAASFCRSVCLVCGLPQLYDFLDLCFVWKGRLIFFTTSNGLMYVWILLASCMLFICVPLFGHVYAAHFTYDEGRCFVCRPRGRPQSRSNVIDWLEMWPTGNWKMTDCDSTECNCSLYDQPWLGKIWLTMVSLWRWLRVYQVAINYLPADW